LLVVLVKGVESVKKFFFGFLLTADKLNVVNYQNVHASVVFLDFFRSSVSYCPDYIAREFFGSNIREIEGILNKLLFYQTTYKKALDTSTVDRIVTEATQQSMNKVSPSQIIKAVSNFFEVSSSDLLGRARNKEFVEPRQITMFLFRDMLSMSYPDIANRIGKRDHTTAIYAYKKIDSNIKADSDLSQKIVMIKEVVNKTV